MGDDAKSLDETAVGDWPIYRAPTPAQPAAPQAPMTAPPAATVVSDAKPSS
jgi:hypothetical protein